MRRSSGVALAAWPSLLVVLIGGCASQPVPVPPVPTPAAQVTPAPDPAVTRALAEADAAIQSARALDWIWAATESLYRQAEAAAAAGENARARHLAGEALSQARAAVNQYYLERAKPLLEEAGGHVRLDAEQQARLGRAARAVAAARGREAYDLLATLVMELRAGSMAYQVLRGDSLWGISGRAEVYANPYQWPLIYRANSERIRDPDLIQPGQTLNIERRPGAAEVAAAIRHARERGDWSLNEVERSDQDYLGGQSRVR